jgi:hypothetical protein
VVRAGDGVAGAAEGWPVGGVGVAVVEVPAVVRGATTAGVPGAAAPSLRDRAHRHRHSRHLHHHNPGRNRDRHLADLAHRLRASELLPARWDNAL